MKLSIIIPAYNEQATIGQVIRSAKNAVTPFFEKEIIIVDDGSSDDTFAAAVDSGSVIVLRHDSNRGKGAAVRTGLSKAEGDVILIQDGDLEYSPSDYGVLLQPFSADALVVYGVRTYKPRGKGYATYVMGSNILDSFVNLLYRTKLKDIYTGYKVFRKFVINDLQLESRGFEVEAEITAKLLNQNISSTEVPVKYTPRTFTEGKKIRPIDGIRGLWTIFKYRLQK